MVASQDLLRPPYRIRVVRVGRGQVVRRVRPVMLVGQDDVGDPLRLPGGQVHAGTEDHPDEVVPGGGGGGDQLDGRAPPGSRGCATAVVWS